MLHCHANRPATHSPRRLRGAVGAVVAVLAVVSGAALRSPPGAQAHPLSHETTRVAAVEPAAGSVVAAGDVTVSALIAADEVADAEDVARVTFDIGGREVAAAVEGDGRGHQRAQVQAALAAGSHVVVVTATIGGQVLERAWRFEAVALSSRRLAGVTRLETAAAVAAEVAAGEQAAGAVLARSDGFADALAGVGLAHRIGGPLLLTAPAALDPAARQALSDHVEPGGDVYLLGGVAALSSQVAADAEALGFQVRRVSGQDRYETAVAIAETSAARTGADDRGLSRDEGASQRTSADASGGASGGAPEDVPEDARGSVAVVVSGEQFADALAASAPAARAGWPLLLTAADALPAATRAYLRHSSFRRIEVVGGPSAVSEAVAEELAAYAPVGRTGGDSRYDTAAQIALGRLGGAADDTGGIVLASGADFADGLAGGVLAAQRAQPLLLAGERLPAASAAAVAALGPAEVTVLGGQAAVAPAVEADVRRLAYDEAVHDVTMEPAAGSVVEQTSDEGSQGLGPIRLRLRGVALTHRSQATVWVGDHQAAGNTLLEGDTLVVELAELPEGLPVEGDVPVRVVASLQSDDARPSAHVERSLVLRRSPQQPAATTTPEGYVAIDEPGAVVGSGGPLRTYSLEVEPSVGVNVHPFAEQAEATLSDPRSWTGRGSVRLQRVEWDAAQIRVLLATPSTVDRLCARAGLRTGGIYSCWNGRIAALNLTRWNNGARGFDAPLSTYRSYVVNHEVGHGLGHGHVGCPGAGRLAPVMMQQTKGTGACVANAWPYP